MLKQSISLYLANLILAMAAPSPAYAWCFGPKSCATDDSVCDMSTNTVQRLGNKTFVWYQTKRQVEIYQRLAYREILDHCQNGQLLILHSDGSLSLDGPVLPDVAKRFCVVASIERIPVHSNEELSRKPLTGFELRCPITKMTQFREEYKAMEAKESTEQMVAEGNRQPPQEPPQSIDLFSMGRSKDPECGKMTIRSILYGGTCAGR